MVDKINKILRKWKSRLPLIFIITILFLFLTGVFIKGKLELDTNPKDQTPVIKKNTQPEVHHDPLLPIADRHLDRVVKRGDTILKSLQDDGVPAKVAYRLVQETRELYDLKRIKAGKKYSLYFAGEELVNFVYIIDGNQYLEVHRHIEEDQFTGKLVSIPYEVRNEFVRGEVTYSLFNAILQCGEQAELADLMASLYEYDIDFNRDIREKDHFSLLVEKKYLEGNFVQYGAILAAEFVNRGNSIKILRFTDPEGRTDYYHPDGKAVKKMFRRCPLPFMRVTSSYGWRRHPVEGFSSRHNGVDFGAPRGTRVLATASGVVQRIAFTGINGRYIVLRHPNRYASYYLHLSGVAKGIKVGKRVAQGQLIGYVGSSGRTTGPHLHYGLQKNGLYLNPLSLKSPSKNPIKKIYRKEFNRRATAFILTLEGHKLLARMVLSPPRLDIMNRLLL